MIKPNRDAEQAVIGAMVAEPGEVLPVAMGSLSEDDFLIPEYRNIFAACAGLYNANRPIDTLTVLSALEPAYKPVVAEAVAAAPTIAHYREYILLVAETARRARAYGEAVWLSTALDGGDPLEECEEAAANLCKSLSDVKTERVMSARECVTQFYMSRTVPREYIRTGIAKLDKYTFIERGDYIIVGARPSAGKTALTLQLMLYMARKHNVVYFSLETSGAKLTDRMVANVTRTPLSQIKQGKVEDPGRVAEAYDVISGLKFHVVDAAGWTVQQIKSKAVQLRAEIIIIDYLSLIRGEGKSLYERVTNISMELHTLAQANRIAVIALSQLNRAGKDEPDMTSLRESGQIEQDADVILLLHEIGRSVLDREAGGDADRRLIIAKNKEGMTGAIALNFQGEYQRFCECETRYGDGL